MAEAYIIDAVRSPVGRRGGALAGIHPADLGAHSIGALMDRVDVDPGAVDDVVFGCVDTIGPQAGDIARTCWLVAGLPDEVPGHDRRSSMRLVATSRALRRASRDVGHRRPGRGGRRAEHERDPDQCRNAGRRAVRLREPVRRITRVGSPVRDAGSVAVPRRRDDRREVGHHARRHGGVRSRVARPRAARPSRGPLRSRDRAAWPDWPPTKARANPTWRRSDRCARWWKAVASPPRCRRRSPTRRRRC